MWGKLTPASVGRHLTTISVAEDEALIARVRAAQPKIDQLVTSYLMRAFESVGLSPREFAAMQDIDLCRAKLREKQIPPAKFWWLQLLAEVAAARDYQGSGIEQLSAELAGELPFYEIELTLMRRVGEQLDQLMRADGTTLIVRTLFTDDLMTRWYEDGVTYRVFNSLAREAVRFALDASAGVRVNVLEVGAGTGGLTAHLLDLFEPNRTRYIFTDVGAFFLRSGRRRFSGFPFVDFKVFDLERPSSEQDLGDETFDLVVANNVIHDTQNIASALSNLTPLMAPGAMLLMVELTDPQIWWHMCFGSLDGWWRFKNDPADPRTKLMLLKKHAWIEVLEEAGFAETAVLSDRLPGNFANRLFLSQYRP